MRRWGSAWSDSFAPNSAPSGWATFLGATRALTGRERDLIAAIVQ